MARFLAELGQGQEPNRPGNSQHSYKIRNLRIGRTCDVRDVADRPYDAKKAQQCLENIQRHTDRFVDMRRSTRAFGIAFLMLFGVHLRERLRISKHIAPRRNLLIGAPVH